jgi:hypothetical protein
MFKGPWIEGQTQRAIYDDSKPDIFAFVVRWTHRHKLEDNDGNRPSLVDLSELWFIADRMLMRELQTEAFGVIGHLLWRNLFRFGRLLRGLPGVQCQIKEYLKLMSEIPDREHKLRQIAVWFLREYECPLPSSVFSLVNLKNPFVDDNIRKQLMPSRDLGEGGK